MQILLSFFFLIFFLFFVIFKNIILISVSIKGTFEKFMYVKKVFFKKKNIED